MCDAEEAQHLVNISLKKIVSWRNKRWGLDLHRNLLLASVLIKAHNACSASSLGSLDDYETSSPVATDDDDDVECDETTDGVTVTLNNVSGFENISGQKDEVQDVDPIQNWDVIPDQALEEWDVFGPDTNCERLAAGDRANVKRIVKGVNTEDVEDDHECSEVSNLENSQPKKRKLEIEGSGNDDEVIACKKLKAESSVSCERLCFDFDELIFSMEGECAVPTVETLDTSNLFTEPLVHSSTESICDTGKNYFDDIDCSTDLLFLCR